MAETQVRFLRQEDPLEKEMATHSSTPAWKIPLMEKTGRLQSTESQRVGHDWATSLSLSVSLDKVSFISWSCLKYIDTGNQKIPSNHYSKEIRKMRLSAIRPGLWKPIKRIHRIRNYCPSTFYKPLYNSGDIDWNANCSRGGLHSQAVRASFDTMAPPPSLSS